MQLAETRTNVRKYGSLDSIAMTGAIQKLRECLVEFP
jgi:hypothetical protein